MPGNDALIAAGAQATGNLINSIGTDAANRKSRKFSREMYERTKTDNLAFWNQQNEYNSPQQQMARFKAAGLNPHLIYGQGNSGPAGSIPTPDVQPVQNRNPEWGSAISSAGLTGINSVYDLKIKQAQYNNLVEQNTVIEQEKLLKMAQTLSTLTGNERARFLLDFDTELRSTSADARREQVRQMKVGTDLSINRDTREAAMNTSNINEAAQRIANMRIQNTTSKLEQDRIRENLNLMRQDGRLKDFDIKLREKGINPNDPMWSRMTASYLADQFGGGGIKKTFDDIWNALFKK